LKYLWSESSNADSIIDSPFIVGVEKRPIFRLKKFWVLLVARNTGDPSVPALGGYLSTSSINNKRIGLDASEAGEFDPAIEILAPFLNVLKRIVLSPSFIFGSPIKGRNALVDLIIGASLSTDQFLAISREGIRTRTGYGS